MEGFCVGFGLAEIYDGVGGGIEATVSGKLIEGLNECLHLG